MQLLPGSQHRLLLAANYRTDHHPLLKKEQVQALHLLGFDGIWMSQFLDCFSDAEIVSILTRCAAALEDNGYIYILELFWDKQRFSASAFCLQMTSLYFTAMANGNSQMYHSDDLLRRVGESGLKVVEDRDRVGLYHTMLTCRKG